MFEHGISVIEQSMTQQLKWSSDLLQSTFARTGLTERPEMPDLINRLVKLIKKVFKDLKNLLKELI